MRQGKIIRRHTALVLWLSSLPLLHTKLYWYSRCVWCHGVLHPDPPHICRVGQNYTYIGLAKIVCIRRKYGIFARIINGHEWRIHTAQASPHMGTSKNIP